MNKVQSFYIELLRVLAAFHVFIYHVGSIKIKDKPYFVSERFNQLFGLEYLTAHYFVLVFFVLSGLLITTSANRRKLSLKDFLVMRLGRLYSVVIPALIFSV